MALVVGQFVTIIWKPGMHSCLCVAPIDLVTTDVDTTDVTTSTTAPTSTMAPTPNLGGLIAAVVVVTFIIAIVIFIVIVGVAIFIVHRRGKQFEDKTQSDDDGKL
jgi:nitrogen fixation-related uncharacterized protein